jgi:hypothetical protein
MNRSSPASGDADGHGQRAPRHIRRAGHSHIQHLDGGVRPAAGNGGASVAVGKRWRIRHGVSLMGAAQCGVRQQLVELATIRIGNDLLECDQIGVNATDFGVDGLSPSGVAFDILAVEGEHS